MKPKPNCRVEIKRKLGMWYVRVLRGQRILSVSTGFPYYKNAHDRAILLLETVAGMVQDYEATGLWHIIGDPEQSKCGGHRWPARKIERAEYHRKNARITAAHAAGIGTYGRSNKVGDA